MGESDGKLSNSDYLNFYANGPSGYDIEGKNLNWNQNLYFNKSTYWLLIPDDPLLRGKRMKTVNKSLLSNFNDYDLSETEKVISSIWFKIIKCINYLFL